MATALQEDLAEAIVKNAKKPRDKRLNKTKLLESVGYATNTAESNSLITIESKGVQESLAKWGLTKELITTALVEDIQEKPGKRYSELNLGAEILGMKEKEPGGNKTLIINIMGETAKRYGITP